MLVLSRKLGESVVIDGEIRVTILEVHGQTVRVGIAAPRSIPVHRSEIFARQQAANQDEAACLAVG